MCQAVWPIWRAVAGSLALVALTLVLAEVVPGWSGDGLGIAVSVLAASMAMFGVVRMAERNAALVCAQEERARLAVVEERERFGRDLHDILGHSLTVIAMKSELAGRLVAGDPERAAAEIADVERLAREALADVRHTVAGVREVTLVGELSAARTALLAAGIEPDLPNAVDEVPGELRETYGYLVREAVTNVVRHSGASRCTVHAGAWGLEVVDDGPAAGHAGTRQAGAGQGLVGLRARVQAAGLDFSAAPLPGRGFRVAATVATATPDQAATGTAQSAYGRPRPATT
jgi:two-component system sensor histidine kinase DesK